MNAMLDLFSGPVWQHLALALLHTLWQGLAAATALGLVLRWIPAHRPEARYWTAFSALLGLLLCGLVTWSVLDLDWSKNAGSAADRNGTGTLGAAVEPPPRRGMDDRGAPPLPDHGLGRLVQATEFGQDARPLLTFVIAGWLAGVALMMARMAGMVVGVRRFVSRQEVMDTRIRQLADELRRTLGLTKALRIVETVEDFGPAVLGIVRPVVVLPVSMLTGLPAEAVRAIMAHELAHIRRHDYLLNLVQMVIEAVLFFNPAVWWISRQIRIEREACCDAMAARILGQPLILAESLALWAERTSLRASAAMAFIRAGRHGPRLLLDRVLRIVLPGYRPQTPLSPLGFLGLLLSGMAVLGALSCGTSVVVELAAKALTPAQRIQRITQTQEQFIPSSIASTGGKATLSGILRTNDGNPVPKKILGQAYTRSGNNSTGATFSVQPPAFSTVVPVGETWLGVTAEGYAPAIVGPFVGKAGETIPGIEVVLDRGFPLTVHVVDAKGVPVQGATVGGNIDNVVGPGQQVTDALGTAVFPHAADGKYVFSVDKPGFEPFYSDAAPIKRGQASVTLTLTPTRPVRGILRSADGRPVAGAEIREFYAVRRQGTWDHTATQGGHVLATSDREGRFVLDQLYNDARYCLLVVTKGQGRQLLDDVSVTSPDLQVKLGPELTVTGKILGDLKKLQHDGGKPVVRCEERARLVVAGNAKVNVGSQTVAVKPVDGGGEFVVRNLLSGELLLTAGEHQASTAVSAEHPQARVSIDLAQPPSRPATRRVVMRFTTPDGPVSPKGKVSISTTSLGQWRRQEAKELPIVDGAITLDAFAPGMLSYESRSLIGYWFQGGSSRIEPGDSPLVIEVPGLPAGAIAGQVFKADGAPATKNIGVSLRGSLKTPRSTIGGGFGNTEIAGSKFFISPLPLGGSYTIAASSGHNIQVEGPIRLDDSHPIVAVTVQLPRTTDASGQVVDPAGKALAGLPLEVEFSDARNSLSHGWSGDTTTDQQGRFRFDDLSVGIGQYTLVFRPRKDFRSTRFPLPRDGQSLTAKVEHGEVLEGRVLDEKTGWPIPGVELFAMPQPFSEGAAVCEAEAPTDREGRFRFSTLEDRSYQIHDRAGLIVAAPDDRIRRPGKEPLVIRATLPTWSNLQPQRPRNP